MARKIWDAFTSLIVILVVVLAILLVGVRAAGLQVYSVLTGSMQPDYPVGSLVYVRPTDAADLQVNDVISFMINETTVVTHRIVEIIPDEQQPDTLWFRTKGDANGTPDTEPLHYRNVIGRVVFAIPLLGYVSAFVQQPPGMYIAMGGAALLLIIAFWPKKKEPKPTPTH